MLVGCSLSLWAYAHLRRDAADRLQVDVEQRADNVVRALESEMSRHVALLARMSVFTAQETEDRSPAVEPDTEYWRSVTGWDRATVHDFESWVDATLPNYPGARRLGWLAAVDGSTRDAYEQLSQATVAPDYRIRQKDQDDHHAVADERPSYFPISRIAPQAGYGPSLGLDLRADLTTGDAIQRACADGTRSAVPVRDEAVWGPDAVVMVFAPVFSDPTQLGPRCASTAIAFGAFDVSAIIGAAQAGAPNRDVHFSVAPRYSYLDSDIWYSSTDAPVAAINQAAAVAARLEFEGYPMTVRFVPSDRLRALHQNWQPAGALAALFLATGVVAALLVQARSRDTQVHHVVAEQAQRLEEARDALAKVERVVSERTRRLLEAKAVLEAESTHRTQLEAQLRHAVKMEAVGTLASGIAHDFNNMLTPIVGACEFLRRLSRPGEPVFEYAVQIEESAERAAKLTRQILAFAREGKLRHLPVEIDRTVRDAAEFVERMRPEATLFHSLRAPGATVMGDSSQLEQVVFNLALNSCDAMPDGGAVTIETDVVVLDETTARRVDVGPGRYVRLRVSDTGPGIPARIRNRIFEPFFTTKAPGKGSGMGLPMVFGIVTNHGGTVHLESQSGDGATFAVYLPVPDDGSPGAHGQA
jgi:signal transduction histidine kinase